MNYVEAKETAFGDRSTSILLVMRDAYGDNYKRLGALKDEYDPTNFFRMNQNIRLTR